MSNYGLRVKCSRTVQNWLRTVSQFVERENFIKSFFQCQRKTRPRVRIDVDLDKLCGNEEQIKHTVERQAEVVNYSLVRVVRPNGRVFDPRCTFASRKF